MAPKRGSFGGLGRGRTVASAVVSDMKSSMAQLQSTRTSSFSTSTAHTTRPPSAVASAAAAMTPKSGGSGGGGKPKFKFAQNLMNVRPAGAAASAASGATGMMGAVEWPPNSHRVRLLTSAKSALPNIDLNQPFPKRTVALPSISFFLFPLHSSVDVIRCGSGWAAPHNDRRRWWSGDLLDESRPARARQLGVAHSTIRTSRLFVCTHVPTPLLRLPFVCILMFARDLCCVVCSSPIG
jgi:hypothetical protein